MYSHMYKNTSTHVTVKTGKQAISETIYKKITISLNLYMISEIASLSNLTVTYIYTL